MQKIVEPLNQPFPSIFIPDDKAEQAILFIPGSSINPKGPVAIQPSNQYTLGDADVKWPKEDFESQLKHEREQHAITKHQLQWEQESLRKVQAELETSKRQVSTLIAGNRLNAEVLKAAIKRIEPKVELMANKMDLLHITHAAHHDDVVPTDGDSPNVLSNIAHSSKVLPLKDGLPQSKTSSIIDGRPSILYDVVAQMRTDNHEIVSVLNSTVHGTVGHKSVNQSRFRPSDESEHEKYNFLHGVAVEQSHHKHDNVVNGVDLEHCETQSLSLDQFHSLDEAFESDFFSNPVRDTPPDDHLPDKEMPDGTLMEFFPMEDGTPRSSIVNNAPLEAGTHQRIETPISAEDHNSTETGAPGGTSTIVSPILGVETVGRDAC